MSEGAKRPLAEAREMARLLEEQIRLPVVAEQWLRAGSLRRGKEMIGDIEMVARPKIEYRPGDNDLFGNAVLLEHNRLWERLDYLYDEGVIGKEVKSDGHTRWGERYRALMYGGWTFEIFLADALNFGLIGLIRTGSAEFSQHVVTRIKGRGVYRVAGGYLRPYYDWEATVKEINAMRIIPCPDEQTVFEAAGMDYVEPSRREM